MAQEGRFQLCCRPACCCSLSLSPRSCARCIVAYTIPALYDLLGVLGLWICACMVMLEMLPVLVWLSCVKHIGHMSDYCRSKYSHHQWRSFVPGARRQDS